MAEVLPPPMPQSSTITMLHARPASADAFQSSQQYHQPSRLAQAPRSMYNGHNHGLRGSSGPVQPYAFQSTPNLRQETRTISAPTSSSGPAANHRATPSASTTSSDSSSQPSTKDESSSLPPRTVSLINISSSVPDLSLTSFEPPAKTIPDRYRRPTGKRVDSGSSNASAARTASPATSERAAVENAGSNAPGQAPWLQRQTSFDNMSVQRSSQSEASRRNRTRSLNQLDTKEFVSQPAAGAAQRPASAQDRSTSSATTITQPALFSGSTTQGRGFGGNSRAEVQPGVSGDRVEEQTRPQSPSSQRADSKVNVPPRASSEAVKRLAAPSPLSREASDLDSPPASPAASPSKSKVAGVTAPMTAHSLSPAAQQLAAVSDKDLNKGMKSRLRRAFSFGSAQELRRAGVVDAPQTTQQTREQHQQQIDDELDAEQMEIARRQEAAGIGAGIYSGQGGFTGSTDNLSISSTASSASMMLRKMGRGAKKSARSIKGLFRPKSVIGVPAADGPVQMGAAAAASVEPSIGQVSMVTVEAERQNVNVNAHPDERTGGGTAFPKLERNSLDAAIAGVVVPTTNAGEKPDAGLRRSIVGNDQDRAEVLAAVRKGILKRAGTASPSGGSPVVKPNEAAGVPPMSQLTESPSSSLPSTPKDGPQGRSSSAPAVNGDYFATRLALAKSMPNTPNGSVRSISFSPRIQFHDAWSSSEYDRRGEIATCNRLTPMLAQQIKEELNTFKMEMEVHELSKPHTHFF